MKRIVLVAVLVAVAAECRAEDWPNWRGPNQNGVAAGKEYPTKWSATENVAWKTDLPGRGTSTPAVVGKNIYVTCAIGGKNSVVCYDREGNEQWRNEELGKESPGGKAKASGSNPSPVVSDEHVFVYYKSGDLGCLDLKGNLVWQHNLQTKYGKDTLWHELGTSPVATKNNIVVAVMQTGDSYVVAFNKATGDVAWKVERNLDAPEESAHAYTTPVVVQDGTHEIIVILGADYVTAHDSTNGKEIWRCGGLNPRRATRQRSIASPVVRDGLVIAPYDRAGGTITAIRWGGMGDVTKTHVAWKEEGISPDVPSPVMLDGKVYVCSDKGDVHCLDAKTGDTLSSVKNTDKSRHAFSASPIVAGGHLYTTREDGKVFVYKLGDELKLVASNLLEGDMTVATPVCVDGKILIRTDKHLFCIGK